MGKHVLVIEDEPNIIEAIRFILTRDGWQVDTHSNGHDADQAIARRAPDLIILDVMLPGKSGYDILKELRDSGSEVPVLMLTARGQSKERDLALRIGANGFMTKPFDNAELKEAVQALVAS